MLQAAIALPPEAVPELIVDVDLSDERLWIPRGPDIWTLPLLFNVTQGSWVNITRARSQGVVSRHRHSAPVTGFTLDGAWGYLEHDWTARQGTFIFEPPGETHTLVVDRDIGHMTVLFHNFGPIIRVDEHGNTTGFDDVFTRIELAKSHYGQTPLGEDYVRSLIR